MTHSWLFFSTSPWLTFSFKTSRVMQFCAVQVKKKVCIAFLWNACTTSGLQTFLVLHAAKVVLFYLLRNNTELHKVACIELCSSQTTFFTSPNWFTCLLVVWHTLQFHLFGRYYKNDLYKCGNDIDTNCEKPARRLIRDPTGLSVVETNISMSRFLMTLILILGNIWNFEHL